jgi:AP-1 complex subunit beta-1
MLLDGNAVVVANACASLLEISKASGKNYIRLKNNNNLNKILAALVDSNEWGKVYILEALSTYETSDSKESENIIERVIPQMTHNNSAVVLSAIKVMLKFMDNISNQELLKGVTKKLAAPLVTLLSGEAEIQYIALRNISFILQKQSHIFESNIRVFFCKFNDPVYVKLEKIDVLVKVADDKTADIILAELKEYSGEIDPEIVRKSVRAIGQIILKVDKASKKAVEIISEIIN